MDYSIVFDLIKNIVFAILKTMGVFDEIEAAGIDINAILEKLGFNMSDPAEPSV